MGDGRGLVPRWWTASVLLLLLLGLLAAAAMTVAAEGAVAWCGVGLLVAFAGLLVAAGSAFLRPRRRREPEVAIDGARTFRTPALTVAGLLAAWVALLVVALLWGWLAIVDLGSLESPGVALATVAAALASVPDLVRVVTGRLHRWTLVLGPTALVYRGYRTEVTVPLRDVTGASIQRRNPAGVRVDLRAARTPVVIPIAAFDVPAEQLVEEVHRARRAAAAR
ncbi:hypothetical protein [Pimelobacter simplex]|uniref:hypothetical protein n=1 Tax=Nocardioides simplex TaxID=2045 RepID=UPI001932841E|nr:hypothetical protein [Pimelobacter simplex]